MYITKIAETLGLEKYVLCSCTALQLISLFSCAFKFQGRIMKSWRMVADYGVASGAILEVVPMTPKLYLPSLENQNPQQPTQQPQQQQMPIQQQKALRALTTKMTRDRERRKTMFF
jgi:hypothetical protein